MIIQMKRVLATGGTGFVGSHLVLALLASGENEVHVTSRGKKLPKILENIPENKLVVHTLDISNISELESLLATVRPERIYHLAACLHKKGEDPDTKELLDTNVIATAALLRYAKRENAPMVNTGTFTEYAPSATPVDEHSPFGPQEFYSTSKLAATFLCAQEGKKGVPVVTLRLFTPYGPEMPDGRIMHVAITNALRNEPIPLSSPTVTRDFIFVSDIAQAYILAGEHATQLRGEVFNIGSGNATTLETLGQNVLELCGSTSTLSWGSQKSLAYDAELWQADNTKARELLKWEPKKDLNHGLTETIAWYRKNT